MPTDVREEIVITDKDGVELLIFHYNKANGITIKEPEEWENPHTFFTMITKEDWIEVKKFIDTQLGID